MFQKVISGNLQCHWARFIRTFCRLIFKLVLTLNGIKEIITWLVSIDDRETFDKLCAQLSKKYNKRLFCHKRGILLSWQAFSNVYFQSQLKFMFLAQTLISPTQIVQWIIAIFFIYSDQAHALEHYEHATVFSHFRCSLLHDQLHQLHHATSCNILQLGKVFKQTEKSFNFGTNTVQRTINN